MPEFQQNSHIIVLDHNTKIPIKPSFENKDLSNYQISPWNHNSTNQEDKNPEQN